MKDTDPQDRQSCLTACEKKFIKCSQKSFTGCVEVLRVCKDNCDIE